MSSTMLRALVSGIAVSSACWAGAAGAATPVDQAAIQSLKSGLDTNLVDYPSARFRDVKLSKDLVSACGFVNAKNRVGGYTGWSQFYAVILKGSSAVILLADDPVRTTVVSQSCSDPKTEWRDADVSTRISPKSTAP